MTQVAICNLFLSLSFSRARFSGGETSVIMVIVNSNLNRTVFKTLQWNHSPVSGDSTWVLNIFRSFLWSVRVDHRKLFSIFYTNNKLVTITACSLFFSRLIGFLILTEQHSTNISGVHAFRVLHLNLITEKQNNLDCLVWCRWLRCAVNHSTGTHCHGLLHEISSAVVWHFTPPLVTLSP